MIRSARARVIAALAIALATAGIAAAAATAAPKPTLTLTGVEQEFICVTCHEPLEVAQSPQALAERSYLASLIAQGQTKSQIEAAMVGQYGPTVLAVPTAQGFNLAFYILPPVLLFAGIVSLVVILPRWRRRARAADAVAIPAGPPLESEDSRRLDEELARYDG
jgi:cytochrome c-type biogenesis protein CcmH/NrfF